MEGAHHRNNLDAKLTGRRSDTSGHFLLECLCPACNLPQYHPPSIAECIYCGSRMNVSHLQLVNKQPSSSGESAGPEDAA